MARVIIRATDYGTMIRVEHNDGTTTDEPFISVSQLDEIIAACGLKYGDEDISFQNERTRHNLFSQIRRRAQRRKMNGN